MRISPCFLIYNRFDCHFKPNQNYRFNTEHPVCKDIFDHFGLCKYRDSWIFAVHWGKRKSGKVQIRENPGQRGKVKAGALEAYENWV